MKDRFTLPVLLLIFSHSGRRDHRSRPRLLREAARQLQNEVEHKLAAIAELKVGEISLWRKERLGDAGIFYTNSAFSGLVRRWLERPEDLNLREELQTWIGHIQANSHFEKVTLLDVQGGQRVSVPDTKEPISSVVRQKVPDVLRSGQVTFLDFYHVEHSRRICLGLLVPILDAHGPAPNRCHLVDGRP